VPCIVFLHDHALPGPDLYTAGGCASYAVSMRLAGESQHAPLRQGGARRAPRQYSLSLSYLLFINYVLSFRYGLFLIYLLFISYVLSLSYIFSLN
jgi:hypothetical protein